MTDNNNPRREPLVARRDVDVSAARPEKFRSPPSGPQAVKTSKVLVFVVVLLMAGCAALAWFGWQQHQSHRTLQTRFDALSQKIQSTDASLSESGAALSVKLVDQEEEMKKHWSEIRKLWGVANDRNKNAIKSLEDTIAENTKSQKKLAGSIQEVVQAQKKLRTLVGELGGDSLAAVARIEEISERIDEVVSDQSVMRNSLEQKLRKVEQKIQAHDLAIESIDAFRRQTNAAISAIQQSSPGAP